MNIAFSITPQTAENKVTVIQLARNKNGMCLIFDNGKTTQVDQVTVILKKAKAYLKYELDSNNAIHMVRQDFSKKKRKRKVVNDLRWYSSFFIDCTKVLLFEEDKKALIFN